MRTGDDDELGSFVFRTLDALGVKRALVYHGIGSSETYQPVGIAIKRIAKTIDARLERMKLCRVA